MDGLGAIVLPRTLRLLRANERLNKVLLGWVVSCHNSARRLSGAEVNGFVWNAWRNKQKISCVADHLVLEGASPARKNGAFQHINARFVPNVYMWFGLRAWWNDNEVHGKTTGTHARA